MPGTANDIPWPDWTRNNPPDELKPVIDKLLRMAIADRLHTRGGDGTGTWGWFLDHGTQARAATLDESEVIWLLEEHGCLVPGQTRVLKDESGEPFNAELMEITPAGRGLFERLNPKSAR
ncbi:hypothetical protein AB0G02_19740 [Actinosynnema sp. NPDC023658]|uniref:hypothetical protein n=1 Tax=Actinosynnema sp. NPDC023658 TaxID=3155465 RepID=UPI0033E09194